MLAIVGWRWFDGSDDTSNQIDASEAPATTDSIAETATTARRATTTTRPASTTEPATTTKVAGDREVINSGEVKACRCGADCLIASFTIDGFDPHPGRFICIYPNSQSDFSFNNTTVIDACITADEGDTITIEADGVRSLTISEENLEGEWPPAQRAGQQWRWSRDRPRSHGRRLTHLGGRPPHSAGRGQRPDQVDATDRTVDVSRSEAPTEPAPLPASVRQDRATDRRGPRRTSTT